MISQLSKCDDLQNFDNPKFSAKHGGWTNVYGNNRHQDNSLNDGQILFNALYSFGIVNKLNFLGVLKCY